MDSANQTLAVIGEKNKFNTHYIEVSLNNLTFPPKSKVTVYIKPSFSSSAEKTENLLLYCFLCRVQNQLRMPVQNQRMMMK